MYKVQDCSIVYSNVAHSVICEGGLAIYLHVVSTYDPNEHAAIL